MEAAIMKFWGRSVALFLDCQSFSGATLNVVTAFMKAVYD
jgi:hypothetical protein